MKLSCTRVFTPTLARCNMSGSGGQLLHGDGEDHLVDDVILKNLLDDSTGRSRQWRTSRSASSCRCWGLRTQPDAGIPRLSSMSVAIVRPGSTTYNQEIVVTADVSASRQYRCRTCIALR